MWNSNLNVILHMQHSHICYVWALLIPHTSSYLNNHCTGIEKFWILMAGRRLKRCQEYWESVVITRPKAMLMCAIRWQWCVSLWVHLNYDTTAFHTMKACQIHVVASCCSRCPKALNGIQRLFINKFVAYIIQLLNMYTILTKLHQ